MNPSWTVLLPTPVYFPVCLSTCLAILVTWMSVMIIFISDKNSALADKARKELQKNTTVSTTTILGILSVAWVQKRDKQYVSLLRSKFHFQFTFITFYIRQIKLHQKPLRHRQPMHLMALKHTKHKHTSRKRCYWCMVWDRWSSAPAEWRVVACAIMDSTRLAVSRNASDSSGRSGRSNVMCADRRLYTEPDSFLFL